MTCAFFSSSTRGIFGWPDYYLPVLVRAGHLKPLGNPPPNSVKFFAALELLKQVQDRTWLAKITNALNQHWQKKNAAKKNLPDFGVFKGHGALASQKFGS